MKVSEIVEYLLVFIAGAMVTCVLMRYPTLLSNLFTDGSETTSTIQQQDPLNEQDNKKQPELKENVQVHPYDDRKYSVSYKIKGSARSTRYGVTSRTITFDDAYLKWTGSKSLSRNELTKLVKKVLLTMPHIRSTPEVVSLLVETAIAESDGGRIIDTNSGDYGMMQIRINTANDLHAWLESEHPDINEAVCALRNKESIRDNLKHNLPYAIAVAATEYWRKAGSEFDKHIGNVAARGVMWKSVYNTRIGRGTVNDYINRSSTYERLTIIASKGAK